jgi:histidinol-phosphate phosphatase family protein
VNPRRFVVLDRDGTIIVERHHLSDPAGVELIPGAAAALRDLGALDLGLIAVTNQSVVGRGGLDEPTLERIHERLRSALAAEGARLDGIFVCPHRPEDGCSCRKPRTGLLERAARELGFVPRDCIIIGDKVCDLALGRAVGARTILVRTGYGASAGPDALAAADHIVDDLAAAARLIASEMAPSRASTATANAQGRVLARRHLYASAALKQRLAADSLDAVVTAGDVIATAFANGGKLLICGNGGSAADAQHVAAEFVGRLSAARDRPALPAMALTTDTSFLTAFANDCGFDGVFARQVEALGRRGDVLLAISTSGVSPNVLRAVEAAQGRGLRTVALTKAGAPLARLGEIAITVPSDDCQHLQEAHAAIEHILCALVERRLYAPAAESAPGPAVRFTPPPPDAIVRTRAGVGVIIADERGHLLLERRSDCGLWGLPGGRIEPGESAEQAAVREVAEETGLVVSVTRLLGVYSDPAERILTYRDNVVHLVDVIVEAAVQSGTLAPSPESLELGYFAPEALPAELVPPARAPLEDFCQGRRGGVLR